MKGFVEFIRQQGVVGFAVGFILGGSISKVVSSFVKDVVNPLLSYPIGIVGNISDAYIQVGQSKIMWGSFVASLIDFLVIAAVVYFGVRGLKLDRLDKKN